MRKPADYMKSLALLQGTDMVLYLVVGLVVALYVGEQAVSPALGNLSPTLARIACKSYWQQRFSQSLSLLTLSTDRRHCDPYVSHTL